MSGNNVRINKRHQLAAPLFVFLWNTMPKECLDVFGWELLWNLFKVLGLPFYEKGRWSAPSRISTAPTQTPLCSLSAVPQHTGASLYCEGNSHILTAFPGMSSVAAEYKHCVRQTSAFLQA